MEELLQFIFENFGKIASWEIVDYTMDATVVELTMLDGEKIQMIG